MSLDSLPFEVFRDIASPLSKRDLRVLSLVNKKLLPFAQTLLFETVSLTLSASWFKEYDTSRDIDARPKWKRDCFFRTLSSLPSFASSISSLTLRIDPVTFNGSPRVSLTTSLLQTATSLRHLHLDGFYSGKGTLPSEVIDAVPSNLRSLELGPLVIDQAGLEKILKRQTSLESLDLSRACLVGQQTISNDILLSNKLAHLRIPHTDADWSPFFHSVVLEASKSLKSFDGPFVSVRTLSTTDFPILARMSLVSGVENCRGVCVRSAFQSEPQPFFRDLRLTLSKTPQLEHLDIQIEYCSNFQMQPTTDNSLFDLMPRSIRHLTFRSPYLFPHSALFRFLASTSASVNLNYLGLCFWQGEEAMRQQVEELCEMRGIHLDSLRYP
ncbi:hypothetical protein JCM3765_001780 [Sporobolomyces pararoseus]